MKSERDLEHTHTRGRHVIQSWPSTFWDHIAMGVCWRLDCRLIRKELRGTIYSSSLSFQLTGPHTKGLTTWSNNWVFTNQDKKILCVFVCMCMLWDHPLALSLYFSKSTQLDLTHYLPSQFCSPRWVSLLWKFTSVS